LQGPRRTLVLRSAAIALGALLLFPGLALADGLTPASPASPNADDTQLGYIVMVVIATLVMLAAIVGLLAAVRGAGGDGERRTLGTSRVQRRVGLALGALAAAVFAFGVVLTESARKAEPVGPDGLQTAQRDLELPAGEAEPLRILVSGQQWLWRYEYPDGTFSYYELVVPVDTPVILDLESVDVQHRWWVPALGGMFDAVPGTKNQTWFKAEQTGTFEGRSTQFSGTGYPAMRAAVTVMEPAEYEAWLKRQAAGIQEAQQAVQKRLEAGDAPVGVKLG
jgi:cytochrome c oxidase subunit II